MSNVIDISSYRIKSDDVLFFDNNVWMFLFCPILKYEKNKQRKYSNFFQSTQTVKACIWINSLVLSEFCNAWLRIEYNKWKRKPENAVDNGYKRHFITSAKYLETIDEIREIIPEILKYSEKGSDNFSSINLNSVYKELGNCDFNDSYYLELASQNNWKIVTDDADLFKNNQLNIEILTANIK